MSNTDWVLGVDLDGVVAQYEPRMREITSTVTGVPVQDIPVASTWSLVKSGWPFADEQEFLDVHRIAVEDHNLYRTLDPVEGASAALWALSDAGIRIRIVTHRLVVNFAHATVVADTVAWLDQHSIPYRDICFVRDKADVGCNLLVDDSPTNILALRSARGPEAAIAFTQEYNKYIDGLRANTWADVVAEVTARSGIPVAYPA